MNKLNSNWYIKITPIETKVSHTLEKHQLDHQQANDQQQDNDQQRHSSNEYFDY